MILSVSGPWTTAVGRDLEGYMTLTTPIPCANVLSIGVSLF